MSIRFFLIGLFSFFSWEAHSQFVQLGDGAFLGTVAGPVIARNNQANYQSKYAYVFPETVLGNMEHGDSLLSLSFYRSSGATFNGNCSLKIWLNNTSVSDWGADPISFKREIDSAKEVYYNHPQTHIGPDDRFYEIPFDKPYVFDTTKGNNLALFVYYEQFDTIQGSIRFYFEGSTTVSGYYSPQVRYSIGTTAEDSLRNATEYHPTIRFSFPKEDQDLHILKTYTLGKIPVPLGNPDSVKVLLRNVGRQDLMSFKCYTYSKGANKQRDSFYVNLQKGKEAIVNVPSLNPSKKGTDTIVVESTDVNTSNNRAISVRLANENIYSYRDITQSPAAGGIGFNGSRGDFVARFQSNKPKNLNQISVMFSGSGRLFKLGIWEHDSVRRMPGKLIWDSDSLITKGGTYILDIPNPVRVNGSFYVGVRQLDLNNVAFGYQMEQPVRPQTFFYAVPNGDTNWVDFSPDAPYKFIIEPRLQADYDLKALSVSLPKDTFNVHQKDTFAPTAQILNMGVNPVTDSFRVRCIIKGPNVVHYDESVYDTLSSGLTRTYSLPKKFAPWEYGRHTLTLIVSHYKDEVLDNDTIEKTFIVGSARDAMVRNAFPSGTGTLIARKDTLLPISTIMNIAYQSTGNFPVVSEIWMGDSMISKQTQSIDLGPLGTQILVWNTFPCNDTGTLKWLVYTQLKDDEYTLNDTQIYRAFIYKVVDIAPDRIVSPDTITSYTMNSPINIRSRVYNEGVLRVDSANVHVHITDALGSVLWQDSMIRGVNGNSWFQFNFVRRFTPTINGKYNIMVFIKDSADIYRENDTIRSVFYVGRAVDYAVDSISLPEITGTNSTGIIWSVNAENKGYENNATKANITATITRNQTTWFEETKTIQLGPEQKATTTFTKSFKPLFTGDYQVRVVVSHPSDVNHINDTVFKTVQVRVSKDAWVDSMTLPEQNQLWYIGDSAGMSQVIVRNQGTDTMKSVVVRAQLTFEKALYFSQIDTLDLAPNESRLLDYALNRRFSSAGRGMHRVWVTHTGDENKSNDTVTHYYDVRSKRDLNLYFLDSPSRGGNWVTNSKLYPVIHISNEGADSAVFPGMLMLQIQKEGQNWYAERLPFPRLEPYDSVSIQATQVAYFLEQGNYQVLCYAENNADENKLNDTLSFGFTVAQNALNNQTTGLLYYPNPVQNNEVTLLSSEKIENVTMLDMLGKKHSINMDTVRTPSGVSCRVKLEPNLCSGTYYLIITKPSGTLNLPIIVP